MEKIGIIENSENIQKLCSPYSVNLTILIDATNLTVVIGSVTSLCKLPLGISLVFYTFTYTVIVHHEMQHFAKRG